MNKISVKLAKIERVLWKRKTEAAKAMQMHPSTLSMKIRGKSEWTIDELNRLSEYLRVDAAGLIGRGEEAENERLAAQTRQP